MLVPRNTRIACFEVSVELLAQALNLPDGACIYDVRMIPKGRSIEVVAQDDRLPAVAERSVIPSKIPQLSRRVKDCGCEEITWSWGE
ncbi:hypothetical protein LCGC14_3008440 [marine sediment metagenome]|uniref:Uncharacterized protein n=1 Tax=marine sediment metagenome TaxID=412755 RepID=A0A0F8WYU1_9ZZZZ